MQQAILSRHPKQAERQPNKISQFKIKMNMSRNYKGRYLGPSIRPLFEYMYRPQLGCLSEFVKKEKKKCVGDKVLNPEGE